MFQIIMPDHDIAFDLNHVSQLPTKICIKHELWILSTMQRCDIWPDNTLIHPRLLAANQILVMSKVPIKIKLLKAACQSFTNYKLL